MGSGDKSDGALSDLKVLDYGNFVTGPYCAKLLGDLGAEVIKIEAPHIGDEARRHEPFLDNVPHPERSGLFLYLNTNKLGITLNLENDKGRNIFKELVADADVLVENHPPQRMPRLGLDYETLRKINPRLIMTSITPFGQSGPYRDYKAHDLNLWHMGGMGYITREGKFGSDYGPPVKGGGRQADFTAGLTAAVATMSAIFSRHLTGLGQWIDISELECIAALPQAVVAFPALEGRIVGRRKEVQYPGGLVNCKDGMVLISLVEENQWKNLFEVMGSPEWAKEDIWMDLQVRIDNAAFLNTKITEWAEQHTSEEILRWTQEKHIPVAALNTSEDVVNDRQFIARDFFVDIEHPEAGRIKYPSASYKFSETPWRAQRSAPLLGQHNEEIYHQRLRYTKEEISDLMELDII